jgi:uncharacterized DUF497 family protein
MEFVFDPDKSAANKAKHGIDFQEAQRLWTDTWLLEAPARTEDEPRFLVVGRLGGKHWTAIFARRDDKVRLISVRRARKQEIAQYES